MDKCDILSFIGIVLKTSSVLLVTCIKKPLYTTEAVAFLFTILTKRWPNERKTDLHSFQYVKWAVKRIIRNTSPCEVFRMIRIYLSTEMLRLMLNCFYMGTQHERNQGLELTQLPLYKRPNHTVLSVHLSVISSRTYGSLNVSYYRGHRGGDTSNEVGEINMLGGHRLLLAACLLY